MSQHLRSRRLFLSSGAAALGTIILSKTLPVFGQALRDGRPQEYENAQPSRTAVLQYMAHLQNLGDTNYVSQPQWCGTRNQRRRLEGFRFRLAPGSANVNLRYKAHLQDIGDTSWHFLGEYVGTRGEDRRLEAFAIEVVGEDALKYDVYYKAHIQNLNDTGWERNGSWCGTRGQKLRVEAISVYLADR